MKILWQSNAPWAGTGYGVQTKLFVPRIRALGHEVAIHCNFGLDGGVINWNGIRCYPKGAGRFGELSVGAHAAHFGADVVIPLFDAWTLDPSTIPSDIPCVPWFPVDTTPLPRSVYKQLVKCPARIAYSRFGERTARDAGLEVGYVPHGVDSKVFRPASQAEAREALGLPANAFIVGMVGMNTGFPGRKGFPQALLAFAEIVKRHPDARLYLHTLPPQASGAEGVDIIGLSQSLGIAEHVLLADSYEVATGCTDAHMARLYNAFDVLLSPSLGEGFGVPILEAQACGCPVIVGDWTSMSELCFAGVKIPESEAERTLNGFGTWWFTPRVGAIAGALEQMYERRSDRARLSEVARNGALQYDADHVVNTWWKPALAEIESMVLRRSTAGNQTVNWDEVPDSGRRPTLRRALAELHSRKAKGAVIVETGTIREAANRHSDGWSTLVFAWYAQATSGHLWTVDVDSAAVALSRTVTANHASHVTHVCADSVGFLRGWSPEAAGTIDLAYLDSLDYADRPRSEAHCLSEALAVLPHLSERAAILIDDTSPTIDGGFTGKGARVVPALVERGFRVQWAEAAQVLLCRG